MDSHDTSIKENHKFNLIKIFSIIGLKKISKSFNLIFSIALATVLLIFISGVENKQLYLYKQITRVSQIGLSILPNLIGFILGGYALIIGFGNTDLFTKMIKPTKLGEYTLYQVMNATFAFVLIIQGFTLTSCFITNLIIDIEKDVLFLHQFKKHNPSFFNFVNVCAFYAITILLTYSILIVTQVVRHVFSFGQMHHFYLLDKILKSQNKEKDSK